jgi:hypothetical protein
MGKRVGPIVDGGSSYLNGMMSRYSSTVVAVDDVVVVVEIQNLFGDGLMDSRVWIEDSGWGQMVDF